MLLFLISVVYSPSFFRHKDAEYGEPPVSASAIRLNGDYIHTPLGKKPYETPRALLEDEIKATVNDYRKAAMFAKEAAENRIADGNADLIAFGRSFIANPDLPERIKTIDLSILPRICHCGIPRVLKGIRIICPLNRVLPYKSHLLYRNAGVAGVAGV